MERRELFSSLASRFNQKAKPERLVRPPYNEDASLFEQECVNCDGKCADACEEKIIKIASDKTPFVDFSQSGCSYCEECAKACEFNVLLLESSKPIMAKIIIDEKKCMSWRGVMCFTCKDPCLDNAIDFHAMFMPKINDKCTACGFCISRCPSEAIKMEVL